MSVSMPVPSAAEQRGKSVSAADRPSSSRASLWVYASAAVIAAVIAAAYFNSFDGAMVLDDHSWILENGSIKQLSDIGAILAPTNARLVGGRPIVSLTLALNYAIGKENPVGYHLVNLLIHVLAALLLFGIVRRTLLLPSLRERFGGVATPPALAVALVWGVHPLGTAAVTYIIQRTESLAALFYLATLYCVIRGATTETNTRRAAWYSVAVAACLLGMLTKETVFTAPILVWLYDRTFLASSFGGALRSRRALYAGLAATWVAGGIMLWLTEFHGGSVGPAVHTFTWQSYLETQPGVILHYLQLAFWPEGLSLDYNWPPAENVSQIVIPGAIVVVLLLAVVMGLMKRSAWGFLGAAFFLLLAPSSSFFPHRDAAFDHRMYLPLAALVALVVLGLRSIWDRLTTRAADSAIADSPLRWAIPAGILTIAVIGLGVATTARNELYASEESIWQDAISKNPRSWRGHASLGYAAAQDGNLPTAIARYENALKLNDEEPKVHLYLADALTSAGKFEDAIHHYKRALRIEPNSAAAHANLATALVRQAPNDKSAIESAISHYQAALTLSPEMVVAQTSLAELFLSLGEFPRAAEHAKAALLSQPNSAKAHATIASALFGMKQYAEAVEHFQAALRIDPNLVQLEGKLIFALTELKRFDEAIVYAKNGLRLQPKNAQVHLGLALLYERTNDLESAAATYEKVLELDPNQETAHLNLGNLLLKNGKLDEAISHFTAILKEDDAPMQEQVAKLYRRQGDLRKAIVHYSTALSIDPNRIDDRVALGQCYAAEGKLDEAVEQFRRAVAVRPNDAGMHNSLAVLLGRIGTKEAIDEALDQFEKAAECDPKDPTIHHNLGIIYNNRDDAQRAAKEFRVAVNLSPDSAEHLGPLAWLLATSPDSAVRNGKEAIELAARAVKLTNEMDPAMLGTLAAGYAETGQYPLAVKTAERALSLAISQQKSSLADELAARVKDYGAGKPYRHYPASTNSLPRQK